VDLAEEALDLGLVNAVHDPVLDKAVEVARLLASKSPLAVRARSLRMASAPSRPHLAPVMSILSLTMYMHAPSMIPVAMGHPFLSAVA